MIVDVSARLDALEGKQQNIESNLADVAMLKSELNTLRSILQVDEGKMANMEVTLRNHSSKISEMGSKVEELDVTQKKRKRDGYLEALDGGYKQLRYRSNREIDG